ncbi:MAG: uroporphyrinogen decarboxylase [Deltaproteobacteria bacterium]|nr:uroporphyrinogen decarboxylase [Deltaproteobacteria bacterium]
MHRHEDSRFIRSCRGLPVDRTPLWLMRQAGRYLPEYQAVRSRTSFLGLCKTPELAAEVTVQPITRFGFDAAIIFSDILVPVEAMGMKLVFDEGPSLPDPLRSSADVEALRVPDPVETMGFVMDAIRLFVRALPSTPLIGFAGAPYTLASYAIEGGGSRDFIKTKRFMYEQPAAFRKLGEKLADTVAAHLLAQIEAGASAVQIFDSWAGSLSKDDYLSFALPYTQQIVDRVKPSGVPVIVFAKGAHATLPELSRSGADVLGIDWTTPLSMARTLTGDRVTLQGNLDPVTLLGPIERIERQVQLVLNEARGARGHVFNLGHGILQWTPPAHVEALVDAVHRLGLDRARAAAGAE